jgi:hypothetical protein
MQEIARQQAVSRWADCTPEHLLYMEQIKREIPDALFINIIRDGRDVALSYAKQGWSYPLPWDRQDRLRVAGLYWEWLVDKGREQGKRLGADYQEVPLRISSRGPRKHCRDWVCSSTRISITSEFSAPESYLSANLTRRFPGKRKESSIPWRAGKQRCPPNRLFFFEQFVGDLLLKLGYSLLSEVKRKPSLRAARMRATYLAMFEAKHWDDNQYAAGAVCRLRAHRDGSPDSGLSAAVPPRTTRQGSCDGN